MSQREYLLWKASEFARFNPRVRVIKQKVGFKPGETVMLSTPLHPTFTEWRRLVYGSEGRKNPLPLLPYCDELALAVWVMDDGSMSKTHRILTIATSSFTEAEHDCIIAWFSERWSVRPAILRSHRKDRTHLSWRFRREDTERIASLIRDFVHPTMRYKLPGPPKPRRAPALVARQGETARERWKFWFGLLQEYVGREGHSRVPRFHEEREFKLGYWVSEQRVAYKAGRLPVDCQRLLEELPEWSWDRGQPEWEGRWEEHLGALRRFAGREGTSRVPRFHHEDGFRLGKWVQRQRDLFREGQLALRQQRRLEQLPQWTWDPLGEAWEEGYTWLKRFVERERHARVLTNHLEEDFKLGQWVFVQRRAFKKNHLSPDRVRRLEQLPGWVWATRRARSSREPSQ